MALLREKINYIFLIDFKGHCPGWAGRFFFFLTYVWRGIIVPSCETDFNNKEKEKKINVSKQG